MRGNLINLWKATVSSKLEGATPLADALLSLLLLPNFLLLTPLTARDSSHSPPALLSRVFNPSSKIVFPHAPVETEFPCPWTHRKLPNEQNRHPERAVKLAEGVTRSMYYGFPRSLFPPSDYFPVV